MRKSLPADADAHAHADLARALVTLARSGRSRDLIRTVVDELGSPATIEIAEGGLIDGSGVRLAVSRFGFHGVEEMPLISGQDHPLVEAARTGTTIAAALPGQTTETPAIAWAVPLVVDGSTVGSLGIGGPALTPRDRTRLHDLAAVTTLALENASLHRDATHSITEIATVLSSLIESRDTYTESHCVALAELSVGVGIRMGLDNDHLTILNLAGHLHDIGKVSIPDEVLLKQGPLTSGEFAVMKSHAAIGEKVLSRIKSFAGVAPVVGQHHERFDGSGYPRGLKAHEIVLEARILSVVDAFDAMTTSRPYRPALTTAVAIQEIEDGAGSQFDPEVAAIFLQYLEGEQAQWKRRRTR